jgi:hypothetical protein
MQENRPANKNFSTKRIYGLALPICYGFCTILPIIWVWQCWIPPMQDLPMHLMVNHLLVKYSSTPFFQQHFMLNLAPVPYLLQDILLGIFSPFGYRISGKLFVSLLWIVMPLCVLFFLKSTNPKRLYIGLFTYPFLWNNVYFKGNLNFLYGVAFLLLAAGYAWRVRKNAPDARVVGILVSLALLNYITHLVTFAMYIFVVSAILILSIRRGNARGRIILLSHILPLLILLLMYFLTRPTKVSDAYNKPFRNNSIVSHIFNPENMKGKLAESTFMLQSFSNDEKAVRIPVTALWMLLMAGGLLRFRKRPELFAILLSMAVIYLILPREISPLVRPHERVFIAALFLSMSCMGFPSEFKGKKLIRSREEFVLVALLCMFAAIRLNILYSKITAPLSIEIKKAVELLCKLPQNAFLAPIFPADPATGKILFARHIANYYVTERNGFVPDAIPDLSNILVAYREKRPPVNMPDGINVEELRTYDYIFVWGDSPLAESKLAEIGFAPKDKNGIAATYGRIN